MPPAFVIRTFSPCGFTSGFPQANAIIVHRVLIVPFAGLHLSWFRSSNNTDLCCKHVDRYFFHLQSESTRRDFAFSFYKQPWTQFVLCWAVGDSHLNVTSLIWRSDKQDALIHLCAFGFQHNAVMWKLSCECDERVLSTPSAGSLALLVCFCDSVLVVMLLTFIWLKKANVKV